MKNSLISIKEILSLHNKLFAIATADVSAEDAIKRINEKGNPYLFIAGHLTWSRYMMSGLLGNPVENPHGDTFAEEYDSAEKFAPLEEVLKSFNDITPHLMNAIENASTEQLQAEMPRPTPTEEQTILSGLSFLAEHEGYHIGQMGYLRVQLGYQSIYDTMFANAE